MNHLGTFLNAEMVNNGVWTGQCFSGHNAGEYAVYFSFTLTGTTEVTLDLTSSTVDTFLALHYRGTTLTSDNDGGTGTNSRIRRVLSIGTYTIRSDDIRPRGDDRELQVESLFD